MFGWLRSLVGLGARPTAGGPQPVRARYDNSLTTPENARHWGAADTLSAKAANNAGVRRVLRTRSRYEVANNPFLFGVVHSNADDLIDTGPVLQVYSGDTAYDRAVEAAWNEWCAEVELVQKLRAAKVAKTVDGEGFLVLKTAEHLEQPVKLYPCDVEADQVTTPAPLNLGELYVDGLVLDPVTGRPTHYTVLKHHPGDMYFPDMNPLGCVRVPAAHVVHWFQQSRPGQVRGVPTFTPSLDLFTELRAFRRAVLGAAEIAADYAAVIEQDKETGAFDVDDDTDSEYQPFARVPVHRKSMTMLPPGAKMNQFDPKQPQTTYEMFQEKCLGEACRPLAYPLNLALGTSQKFNFSSAKLDHINYRNTLTIERDQCSRGALAHLFRAWFAEAALCGAIPRRTNGTRARLPRHQWHWPGFEPIDPVTDAQADHSRLSNGTDTYQRFWARRGLDWQDVMRQQAREQEAIKKLGIQYGEPAAKTISETSDGDPPPPPANAGTRGRIRAKKDADGVERDDLGRFGKGNGSGANTPHDKPAEKKEAPKEEPKGDGAKKGEPKPGSDSPAKPGDKGEGDKAGANDWQKHAVVKKFQAGLLDAKSKGLSEEQKKSYSRAAGSVLAAMPPAALDRLEKGMAAAVFHSDTKSVGALFTDNMVARAKDEAAKAAAEELAAKVAAGRTTIGGFYSRKTTEVHADGGMPSTTNTTSAILPKNTAAHVYAHEWTHAIDGPNNELSRSAAWEAAHAAEIKGEQLTKYAATKQAEGFAEFGRLLYAGDLPHAEVEKKFPKASAFFKSHGLWPRPKATPATAARPPAPADRGPLAELFGGRIELPGRGGHADVFLDPDAAKAAGPTVRATKDANGQEHDDKGRFGEGGSGGAKKDAGKGEGGARVKPEHAARHKQWEKDDAAIEKARDASDERDAKAHRRDSAKAERDLEAKQAGEVKEIKQEHAAEDKRVEDYRAKQDARVAEARAKEDAAIDAEEAKQDGKEVGRKESEMFDRQEREEADLKSRQEREYESLKSEMYEKAGRGELTAPEAQEQMDRQRREHAQEAKGLRERHEDEQDRFSEEHDFDARRDELAAKRDDEDADRAAERSEKDDAREERRERQEEELEERHAEERAELELRLEQEAQRREAERDAARSAEDRKRYLARLKEQPDAHGSYYDADDHDRHGAGSPVGASRGGLTRA